MFQKLYEKTFYARKYFFSSIVKETKGFKMKWKVKWIFLSGIKKFLWEPVWVKIVCEIYWITLVKGKYIFYILLMIKVKGEK